MNRRLTVLACVAGLAMTAATTAAPPAHVFIALDEDDDRLTYWDAASVQRVPDGFTFRQIDVAQGQRKVWRDGVRDDLQVTAGRWTLAEISCAARSLRIANAPQVVQVGDKLAPAPVFGTMGAPAFIGPNSVHTPIADRLCSGAAPPTKGLTSEAAIAAAFIARPKILAPPPDILPPPPLPISPLPIPPAAPTVVDLPRPAWVDGPHRYAPVLARNGLRLYIDRESLRRQGDIVDGVSLVVLEQAPPNLRLTDNAALQRHVRYDCARATMTVRGQTIWNGYGSFGRIDEAVAAPRAASQSPVVAGEIAAACGPPGGSAEITLSSVREILDVVRSSRPPRRAAWKTSCLWTSLSPNQRVIQIDLWKDRNTRLIDADAPLSPDLDPVWEACGVPKADQKDAAWALRQKAIQYGAVQRLIDRNGTMIESRLLTAWRAVPEKSRRRFGLPYGRAMGEEQAFQKELIQNLAAALNIRSDKDLNLVADYVRAQAILEGDLELPLEAT